MQATHDQLAAFAAVVEAGSFTRAAKAIHLSQPALSRRIAGLEDALAVTLLVRGPTGPSLTDAGRRVLAFVHAQRALEDELLGELQPSERALRGEIRVVGPSSIVPAMVLPGLAALVHEHPQLQVEARTAGHDVMADLLRRGAVDFIVTDTTDEDPAFITTPVGLEEHVMIESLRPAAPTDVYLDSSVHDRTTAWFFAEQPPRARPRRYRRSFLQNEAGILLGVELGLGRAVKPRQTIPATSPVRVMGEFRPVRKPFFLRHRAQRFYSRLHHIALDLLAGAIRDGLAASLTPPRRSPSARRAR
jgi:DNA-binding transcriptional LysR family regulator